MDGQGECKRREANAILVYIKNNKVMYSFWRFQTLQVEGLRKEDHVASAGNYITEVTAVYFPD